MAMVVSRCPVGQLEYNLERTRHWTRLAKNSDADIVCFPELNISGYSLSPPPDSAQPLDSPIVEALMRLADEQDVVVLAGMLEKDAQGRLYATHLVAVPGRATRPYRKLHIAPPEQGLLTAGNAVPVFKTQKVTFGVQLCYDAHFPELTTRMALAGAELVFIPHASPRGTPQQKMDSWRRHLPARAFDNSLFVMACNQTGDNGQGLSFPGAAMALGPDGRGICRRTQDSEGLLIADLKCADLQQVRTHRMRFFLPHRRGDLYNVPGNFRESL